MNLLWFGVGIMTGIAYTFTQWLMIQKLTPNRNQALSVKLIIGSSVFRYMLISALLLAAIRQGPFNAIILLIGFLAARWLVLFYKHQY